MEMHYEQLVKKVDKGMYALFCRHHRKYKNAILIFLNSVFFVASLRQGYIPCCSRATCLIQIKTEPFQFSSQ